MPEPIRVTFDTARMLAVVRDTAGDVRRARGRDRELAGLRLAEAFDALDGWLSAGQPLPPDWEHH